MKKIIFEKELDNTSIKVWNALGYKVEQSKKEVSNNFISDFDIINEADSILVACFDSFKNLCLALAKTLSDAMENGDELNMDASDVVLWGIYGIDWPDISNYSSWEEFVEENVGFYPKMVVTVNQILADYAARSDLKVTDYYFDYEKAFAEYPWRKLETFIVSQASLALEKYLTRVIDFNGFDFYIDGEDIRLYPIDYAAIAVDEYVKERLEDFQK